MKIRREAYGLAHADPSPIKDVYGGDEGMVFVECMRIRPAELDSKTGPLFFGISSPDRTPSPFMRPRSLPPI